MRGRLDGPHDFTRIASYGNPVLVGALVVVVTGLALAVVSVAVFSVLMKNRVAFEACVCVHLSASRLTHAKSLASSCPRSAPFEDEDRRRGRLVGCSSATRAGASSRIQAVTPSANERSYERISSNTPSRSTCPSS